MDFNKLSDLEKQKFAELMFAPLSSPQELKDWIKLFLGFEYPDTIADRESNSNPLDAIWQIYNAFKLNDGQVPGAIWLSARECLKCQIKGTKILTKNSLKNIEDVQIGDVIWTGFSWKPVTNVFDEGVKPALQVKVKNGITVTGTPIHRYWVLRDGVEQWIKSEDLNPKTDLMCLNTNIDIAHSNIENQEMYDIGYFLGVMVGDGCCTLMDKYKRIILSTADEYILNFYKDFISKKFNKNNVKHSKGTYDYFLNTFEVVNKLKEWGLHNKYAWEKTVPRIVWENVDSMKGFIAGVFDTDGSYTKNGHIKFNMTAGKLLEEMQIILASFGIRSSVFHSDKLRGMQKHLVSTLNIGRHEALKLQSLGIEFKSKKAQKFKKATIPNCKDTIPINHVRELFDICDKYSWIQIRNRKILKSRNDHGKHFAPYKAITIDRANRLCVWMRENYEHGFVNEADMDIIRRYEKTLSNKWESFRVEKVENQYFYDLTVENDHSYWSNGVISHNTVSVAILEMILMLHFKLEIAHAAATEAQSHVCIRYIEGFLLKIESLISAAGWINSTANKRTFEFTAPDGNRPFIRILIASTKGMNSTHANLLCVDGNENVWTSKGKIPIKNVYDLIVNKKQKIYAKTFNHSIGVNENKEIVAAHYNGVKKCFKLVTENGNTITATLDHRVLTPSGYKEIGDLFLGDSVCFFNKSKNKHKISSLSHETPSINYEEPKFDQLEQFLIGSLLGDGHVGRRPNNNAFYAETHSPKQADYAEWKASLLKNTFKVKSGMSTHSSGFLDEPQYKIFTGNTPLLNEWVDFKNTLKNVDRIEALGMAIWYMDDGMSGRTFRLSTHSFTYAQNVYLSELLNKKFGFKTNVKKENKKDGRSFYYISGSSLDIYKLAKICGKYFHPSMLYKIEHAKRAVRNCAVCNKEFAPSMQVGRPSNTCGDVICRAIDVGSMRVEKIKSITNVGDKNVYDLTIKDNHNMILNEGLYAHQCIDELDLADPIALAEGKNIVGYSRGIHGFTLFLSTRKYSSGPMASTIENRHETGYSLLRWNIMDLCEKCPPSRHKPELPKESRYVAKELPLIQISVPEWELLAEADKRKYDLVENAHAGCKECLLLPICKTNLSKLPDTATGGFYKPIKAVIQKFRENSPEIASSQLLCWTPGSAGLVYPRFLNNTEKGNVITLQKAYEELTGDNLAHVNELTLLNKMQELGIQFYAGVDWGFTHDAVISIVAELPNGDIWGMDCFASPGLEFADILEVAKSFRDKYNPSKWFCDTAMPSHIKSFNKNGMKSPNFKKDVPGGIEALRAKIVNASGKRSFKVLQIENNKKVIHAFSKHMFILDNQGNPTDRPGDEITIADIMDSYRYIFQNKWPVKGPQKPSMSWPDQQKNHSNQSSESTEMMKNEIFKRVVEGGGEITDAPTTGSKGGLKWNL